MIVAVARVLREDVTATTTQILVGGAVLIIVLLGIAWAIQSAQSRRQRAAEEAEQARTAAFDPMEAGFPVPPMPGQSFSYTSRRSAVQGTTIVQEPPATSESSDEPAGEEPHA